MIRLDNQLILSIFIKYSFWNTGIQNRYYPRYFLGNPWYDKSIKLYIKKYTIKAIKTLLCIY